MKLNYYSEAIEMLMNGVANELSDEEFLELLKSMYSDEQFKENVLLHCISDLREFSNHSNILQRVCNEKIYLIYEALELKRIELNRSDEHEN